MEDDSALRIAEEVTRAVPLDSRRVLEIGCGNGRVSALLAGRVGAFAAVDPDREGVRAASRLVPQGAFCAGSGEALPFPDGRFDCAVFTLSLHHQDPVAALGEAARVVRPGGAVVVVEPAPDGGEVGAVFSVVHDETRAKQKAQEALAGGGLRLRRGQEFAATWRFRDEGDLCRTVFGYYGKPYNREQADRIGAVLGARRGARPLVLEDRMMIQVLAVD